LLPSNHWARDFKVEADDIDYLVNLLLEKEIPLTTAELAHALVQNRLNREADALKERFKNVHPYNPSQTYQIGQRLVFPHLDFATAEITAMRPGDNPEYGEFTVLSVQFDDRSDPREFAAELTVPHKLSQSDENGAGLLPGENLSVDDIMATSGADIIATLETRLQASDELVHIALTWFPRDLMLEVDLGNLNLAEAVLDLASGGPLTTENILQEIGGLGNSPQALQVFSMNYALNEDDRFDEVGPAGKVLWYLTRMEPPEVRQIPPILRHTPIEYDRGLLTADMLTLEAEIGDELSSPEAHDIRGDEAVVTLIYPHRRLGTLPLNQRVRHLFPTAQRTNRIFITLIDAEDETEYTGWVVPEGQYVLGLDEIYRKHRLPIGAYVTVQPGDDVGRIRIALDIYRARSEWVGLTRVQGDTLHFENDKRAIGANYDDMMLLGVEDLEALEKLTKSIQQQKKPLAALLRMLLPGLGKLTPQGTAHVKTIYSAVNLLRRCPPGPIMATLIANPDFENVGGHYWKLAE
jgi:hypothetical protein